MVAGRESKGEASRLLTETGAYLPGVASISPTGSLLLRETKMKKTFSTKVEVSVSVKELTAFFKDRQVVSDFVCEQIKIEPDVEVSDEVHEAIVDWISSLIQIKEPKA